jgi:hypothetical protein
MEICAFFLVFLLAISVFPLPTPLSSRLRPDGCVPALSPFQFVSPDSSQKYKEGKVILEKVRLPLPVLWTVPDTLTFV